MPSSACAAGDGPAATTLDDTYAQLEGLGELTGREDEAEAVVEAMQDDIAAYIKESYKAAEKLGSLATDPGIDEMTMFEQDDDGVDDDDSMFDIYFAAYNITEDDDNEFKTQRMKKSWSKSRNVPKNKRPFKLKQKSI